MDAQSMISVSLSRRSSICSNSSALAFTPAHSPIPNGRTSPPQDQISYQERTSLPPDPAPQPDRNHLSLPRYNEKRLSTTKEDSISMHSTASAVSNKKHSKFGAKVSHNFAYKTIILVVQLRQKADQLLHLNSNRKSVEEFNDYSFTNNYNQSMPINNSRPQSIASSSGFASVVSSGNLDNLNDGSSKEYLLQIIGQLRKELQLKEHRIQDLETYTGSLLSKIIEKYPELLQVN